ncbi:hypothetical protein VNO78_17724 [Psophocarpus tetragonolobus]|uniref:C2H2-type domain-containing protein n=1 Tax=Psophocarpus tetragonolobus TaxID=3891 RepID=A0AAN9XL77_PSOTE
MQEDHMQIIKGKRTKRQRLPSPLRLTMSTCSVLDNSVGFDLPTTSDELRNEEEDMANCLILLAQGHNAPKPSHNKGSGLYLYECKTCNRCFPSFQALGGHRSASHKKYSKEEKHGVTTFVNELVDNNNNHHHDYCHPTSTSLTLQLSTALYHNSSTFNAKSKVHECSICGAQFSSGQALGGHMRRHRNFLSGATANGSEIPETKKHKRVLNLDLNLPAPDHGDHNRESKLFPYQSKEQVVFSATSLVDCHY